MKNRRFNNLGVSTSVGTVLMVAIMVTTSSALLYVGVPVIEKNKTNAMIRTATSQLKIADELTENLIYSHPGSTGTFKMSTNEGNIEFDSKAEKIMPIYTMDQNFDFEVKGFEDDDNEVDIKVNNGQFDKAIIRWDIDGIGGSGDCTPPSVETESVEDESVYDTYANVYGVLEETGSELGGVKVGFIYWEQGSDDKTTVLCQENGEDKLIFEDEIPFAYQITGLDPETDYNVQAIAIGCDSVYGLPRDFTTKREDYNPPQGPRVTTWGYSNRQDNGGSWSAVIYGNLDSFGSSSPATVYFKYGTSSSQLNQQTPDQEISDSAGDPPTFSATISGLPNCVNHYYQAWAETDEGVDFGNIRFLPDLPGCGGGPGGDPDDPEILTLDYGDTDYGKDYLNFPGEVTSLGDYDEISVYFEYWRTCFLAGTKISMADGSYKNIEDVEIGDMVKAFDEKSKSVVNSKVTEIFHHKKEEMSPFYLIFNNLIKVTPEHMIFVNGEWIDANSIKIGDSLKDISGKTIEVESINRISEKVPTYNFEVDIYHNYYAENILVHNAKHSGPHQYTEPMNINSNSNGGVFPYQFTIFQGDLNCDRSFAYVLWANYGDNLEIQGLPSYYSTTDGCDCSAPTGHTGEMQYFSQSGNVWFFVDVTNTGSPSGCNGDLKVSVKWDLWNYDGDHRDGDDGDESFVIISSPENNIEIVVDTLTGLGEDHYFVYTGWAAPKDKPNQKEYFEIIDRTCGAQEGPKVQTLKPQQASDPNNPGDTNHIHMKSKLTSAGATGQCDVFFRYELEGSSMEPIEIGRATYTQEQIDNNGGTIYHNIYTYTGPPAMPNHQGGNYEVEAYAEDLDGNLDDGGMKAITLPGGSDDLDIITEQLDPIDVEATWAKCEGLINEWGGVLSVTWWFKVGIDVAPYDGIPNYKKDGTTSVSSWAELPKEKPNFNFNIWPNHDFNHWVSDLEPETTYVYKAFGEQTFGAQTDEGEPLYFTTDSIIDDPVVQVVEPYGPLFGEYKLKGVLWEDGNEGNVKPDGQDCGCKLGFDWKNTKFTCLLSGTKVSMADGSYKNIEDVEIGDMVKAFDESSKTVVDSRVTDIYHHNKSESPSYYLIINNILKITSSHKLHISNGLWEFSEDIVIGDKLQNIEGEEIVVNSIEKIFEKVPTYNLEIEKYHNYYAENILVHNGQTQGGQQQNGYHQTWLAHTIPFQIYTPYGGLHGQKYGWLDGFKYWTELEDGDWYIRARAQNCQSSVINSNEVHKTVSSCLLSGTKISMADGSYKNIEDVEIGDMVKAFDESSKSVVDSKITNTYYYNAKETVDNYYLIINGNLHVTPDHDILINGEWIRADNIKIGDALLDMDNEKVVVFSIDKIFEKVEVYNLEVNNYHNFYAEDLLVHNIDSIGGDDEEGSETPAGPSGQSAGGTIPPGVEAIEGKQITGTQIANLKGSLTKKGSSGTPIPVAFEYCAEGQAATTIINAGEVNNVGEIFEAQTGSLSQGKYGFRAIAYGTDGTIGKSSWNNFIIAQGGVNYPSVTTLEEVVDANDDSIITFKGRLDSKGSADSVNTYFEYRKSSQNWNNPASFGSWENLNAGDNFETTLDVYGDLNLPTGGSYYYRAIAEGIATIPGGSQTVEETDQTTGDVGEGDYHSANNFGQTFTAGMTGFLSKVSLKIKKVSSGGGFDVPKNEQVVIRIFETDNGIPTGSPIAQQAISSDVIGASYGFVDVEFTTPAAITENTMYAVVIYVNGLENIYYWQMVRVDYTSGSIVRNTGGYPAWTIENGDLMLVTYVEYESEQEETQMELRTEGNEIKFDVPYQDGGDDPESNDYLTTDQVYDFSDDPIIGGTSRDSITLKGFYSSDTAVDGGYENDRDGDQVTNRNFVIDHTVDKKGLAIDLFNDGNYLARIWMFNSGKLEYDLNGNKVISTGNAVIENMADSSPYMRGLPIITNSLDGETINIRIVQMKSDGIGIGTSGGGEFTFLVRYDSEKTRFNNDNVEKLRIQVHGPYASTWRRYLKEQGFEDVGAESSHHELEYTASSNKPSFNLQHSILHLNLQTIG